MSEATERLLCRVSDIPDGGARGFAPDTGGNDKLFAVRRGAAVYVYLNTCPHNWRPLDWAKDKFLACPGGDIVCFAHGAHFDVASGECTAGICEGQYLISVPARIANNEVLIPTELPEAPE